MTAKRKSSQGFLDINGGLVVNKWLKVKDSKGNLGYVAAWLVSESST